MISVDRIFRDYRESGALNELLAVWGFVDNSTFLTKAGDVGVVLELKGPDATALTHEDRERVTHQFEAALRLLDERVRVYQYFIKEHVGPFAPALATRAVAAEAFERRAAYLNGRRDQLFTVGQYVVLLLQQDKLKGAGKAVRDFWSRPIQAIREQLSLKETARVLESQIEALMRALSHATASVSVQLANVQLKRMNKGAAFKFLRRLVNFDPHVLAASCLRYDSHVDYFLSDSPVECHRDHLRIGSRFVTALSMKEPPARTYAHMLSDLMRIPCEFVACLEWQRLPAD